MYIHCLGSRRRGDGKGEDLRQREHLVYHCLRSYLHAGLSAPGESDAEISRDNAGGMGAGEGLLSGAGYRFRFHASGKYTGHAGQGGGSHQREPAGQCSGHCHQYCPGSDFYSGLWHGSRRSCPGYRHRQWGSDDVSAAVYQKKGKGHMSGSPAGPTGSRSSGKSAGYRSSQRCGSILSGFASTFSNQLLRVTAPAPSRHGCGGAGEP